MKNLFTITFLCSAMTLFGQSACFDESNSNFENDEPPGCSICGQLVEGRTLGYTPDDFNFDFPCGEVENSQWFTLLPKERQIDVNIEVKSCLSGTGIEAAIYDKNFNLVSDCAVKDSIGFNWSIKAENLAYGELHHLMIDGVDNSDCNFEITVQGDFKRRELRLPFIKDDRRGNRFCFGEEVCFSVPRSIDAATYNWSLTPTTLETLSGGGPNDTFICTNINVETFIVLFNSNGICETVNNGIDFSSVFDSIDSRSLTVVDTIVCSSECVSFLDSCYYEEGTHSVVFENQDSLFCDTSYFLNIAHKEVFDSPSIECKDLDDKLLLEWEIISGVIEYIIFINQDSFTTTTNNFITLENLPIGEPINFKVQPLGGCTYLPAEITCTPGFTNTNDDFLDGKISVFPNPTTGNLNIETDLQIEEIEIYDANGRFLQKEKTTSFELENRDSGIYILKIKTNEGVGVKRILVSSQ